MNSVKASPILLVLAVFFLVSYSGVSAQTNYITIYGRLSQFQCPVGAVSGPCTGFSLTTNGTTPGIPTNPMLDFSQSIVPAPAQSDVGKTIMATGYYGQESQCSVTGCSAFFVYLWGPHYGSFSLPTTTGCFTSSNPPTTWYSVQCVSAPNIPLGGIGTLLQAGYNQVAYVVLAIILIVMLGYVIQRRKK